MLKIKYDKTYIDTLVHITCAQTSILSLCDIC